MNIRTTAKPTPAADSRHLFQLEVRFFQASGVLIVCKKIVDSK
jgi:hypothetical protein